MCIAILKPKGRHLHDWVYANSFAWHSDGAGFLVHDHKNNKLICQKGFFTLEAFREAFAPYECDYLAVVHFRKTTHGETTAENCHPFLVNDGLGFVHNGVICDVKMYNKQRSDTWHFNETILKPLVNDYSGKYTDIWKHHTLRFLIEKFISDRSKLVFLNSTGSYKIFNDHKGHWDSQCWFSNDTYKYNPYDMKVMASNPKALDRAWDGWEPNKDELGKDTELLISELDELYADGDGIIHRELDLQLDHALSLAD